MTTAAATSAADPDPLRALMPYPAVAVPSSTDGPLAGLRFAVKDLFDVAGYPTSCGSPHKLALSGIKQTTAPSVVRLPRAGAVFAGKARTDELEAFRNMALRLLCVAGLAGLPQVSLPLASREGAPLGVSPGSDRALLALALGLTRDPR